MNSCPLCSKAVDSFHETDVETPFTHHDPFVGLNIWGPLDAAKEVVCQDKQFVHFVLAGAEHRLVQMGTMPTTSFMDDIDDDFDEYDDYSLYDDEDNYEHDEEDFPNGSLDY